MDRAHLSTTSGLYSSRELVNTTSGPDRIHRLHLAGDGLGQSRDMAALGEALRMKYQSRGLDDIPGRYPMRHVRRAGGGRHLATLSMLSQSRRRPRSPVPHSTAANVRAPNPTSDSPSGSAICTKSCGERGLFGPDLIRHHKTFKCHNQKEWPETSQEDGPTLKYRDQTQIHGIAGDAIEAGDDQDSRSIDLDGIGCGFRTQETRHGHDVHNDTRAEESPADLIPRKPDYSQQRPIPVHPRHQQTGTQCEYRWRNAGVQH